MVQGERTLPLWGKLFWGAKPLTASTPGNGIPDGDRNNPLASVGLDFTGVSANLPASIEDGDPFSVQMSYSYWKSSSSVESEWDGGLDSDLI